MGMMRALGIAGMSVVVLLTLAPVAESHEPEPEETLPHGVTIGFTPREVVEGDKVPLEAHIEKDGNPLRGAEVVFTVDNHGAQISDRLTTVEREDGHYFAVYPFIEREGYEVHVEFTVGGEPVRYTADIAVIPRGIDISLISFGTGALILIALVWFLSLKRSGRTRHRVRTALILSLVILGAAGLGYSLYKVIAKGSVAVVTCPTESSCLITAHWHVYVPTEICGEYFRFSTEVGSLQGPHTHEEKNVIHWHNKLPYDKTRKTILDTAPLTVGAFFDALSIPLTPTSIGTKTNGDLCPDGKPGTVKMLVNGKSNAEFRSHLWHDREVIHLFFDSRTAEEIERVLQLKPVKFPALGRG